MTSAHKLCRQCGAAVPVGHLFCGRCGTVIPDAAASGVDTVYYGALQEPGRAKLVLIRGEVVEGTSYHLNASHHPCGRRAGVIPFEDPYLDTAHADFFFAESGQLMVADVGSLNGVYCRIRERSTLQNGDLIRAGDHLFVYQELASEKHAVDGISVYASPKRAAQFRIVELSQRGLPARAYASPNGEVAVGRSGCDLNYPDDVYMSSKHFRVTTSGGVAALVDSDSHNGTFLRIREPAPLQHEDYLFLGQQLLRVEITQR